MSETEVAVLRRRLAEMAQNLWWSWEPEVIEIFRDIDPDLWRRSNHNPIVLLGNLNDEELAARVEGKGIESRINVQFRRLGEYLTPLQSFGQKHAGPLCGNP